MKDIILAQKKAYSESYMQYGPTIEGLKWNNKETQYLRFERLILQFGNLIKDASIHDIGSGLCDLHAFLIDKNIVHTYSGTEIVDDMVDVSRKRYPNITVFNRDFNLAEDTEMYDLIVLSGTLNLRLDQSKEECYKYAFQMIRKMFQNSRKAISFNVLTTFNTFESETLMYYNPGIIIDFCVNELSRFVNIDFSYPLFEYTVTVFHEEIIHEKYNGTAFSKYFKN